MATRSSSLASAADFYAALLAKQDLGPRASIVANYVAQLVSSSAVIVYVVSDSENPEWVPKASEGEVSIASSIPLHTGSLGELVEYQSPVVLTGKSLRRESVSYLDVRKTLSSIAYVPILDSDRLVGAIEVLGFEQPITQEELAQITGAAEMAAAAISSAVASEAERNANLQSISRLTQLYDLVKVFSSTLEMSELFPIISSKFKDLLEVQAVNFWMIDADYLILHNRAGSDPTVALGTIQKSGEGYLADVADSGEPLILDSAQDPRLAVRNANSPDTPVWSAIAAPIIDQNSLVGVVEIINKNTGQVFHEDDLFFLSTITESAASALHNASQLQAERKVEILQALVKVSHQITSTLNMDRVLQSIVNGPSTVVAYERAAIALEQSGRVQVKAISGMPQVNAGDIEVARLREILQWASSLDDELLIRQVGEEIDNPRPETREKFRRYFSDTGARAFYVLPLSDEQGRVGVLSFESGDPEFLGEAQLEMIRVLAGQATVALRNASLYKEVPFIGVLEPLLQRKRRFLALERRKRLAYAVAATAALVFLVVVPFPMRVDGDAFVQPSHSARVQPEIPSVVKQVYVREGEAVKRGTILADLDDWDARTALATSEARYAAASSEMNRALAANDDAEAGIKRVEVSFWSTEVGRARQRLEHAHLRSPISGVVSTPFIENDAGRSFQPGETFAEIVDTSTATVDVALDERDVPLLKTDERSSIKLTSYPTRTFQGKVRIVSPKGQADGEGRYFYARVDVDNPDDAIRPGMQGRGKVFVGWRPAGYVLLRRPAMWIWSHLWSWFG